MKKIVLLLTTIMIVSVLNGCNLSNNETKDVKNKEEISYSNVKNKKETEIFDAFITISLYLFTFGLNVLAKKQKIKIFRRVLPLPWLIYRDTF